MEYTCSYVAEDLVINILSRLPIKALARFTCVSKEWHHLISDTISKTIIPKVLVFSCLKPHDDKTFVCHTIDNDNRVESISFPIEEKVLQGHYIKAHCSSNGLVLIQIDSYFFIWNPLTKFFRKVLTYDVLHGGELYKKGHNISADLCYDFHNDVYKVLLVHNTFYGYTFYVGTCGDNHWKEIEFFIYMDDSVYPGPLFKGYRHWVRNRLWDWFDIIYFDPHTNVFVEIPMPQPKGILRNTYYFSECCLDVILGLGVLDGCLCMTRLDHPRCYDSNIEFLAMKEYGNGDSWEIMFVISNKSKSCYNMIPLFRTKENEVLVTDRCDIERFRLKAYDVCRELFRDMAESDSFNFILHEESWFSPTVYYKVIDTVEDDAIETSYDGVIGNDISGNYSDDTDIEEYSIYDILEFGNSAEERIMSQKKRRKKNTKKKKSCHIKMITRRSRINPCWSA